MNIYVSVNAVEGGNGTLEKPFKTINEAKEYVKTLADDNIAVNIMGGRYFFDDTLRFTSEDKSCTYQAYNGAEVFFDGGIVIDNSLAKKITDEEIKSRIIEEDARDKVYEVDLSGFSIELARNISRGHRKSTKPTLNELFINTKPQSVARYPKNEQYIVISNIVEGGNGIIPEGEFDMRKPVLGYSIPRGDKWAKANHAYMDGFLARGFADSTILIENIDTEKRLFTLAVPAMHKIKYNKEHRWRIINLLEEIGEPGEYYIDVDTQKLYFYPECDINEAFIQMSVIDTPILSFIGAENITVKGITFENSRGTGVYIGEGKCVHIEDCTFRNLGILAVQIGKGTEVVPEDKNYAQGRYAPDYQPVICHESVGDWENYLYTHAAWNGDGGHDHLVSGCDIYDIGNGGILIGGGDRKKLIPANNKVYNCHIRRVNRAVIAYRAGVSIWGVGNVISHCEIEELDGTAIYLHGNDHLIEYNKIHNVIRKLSDGGAIYMGRDQSEVGNAFRYNFIYNIKNPHSYDMYGYAAIYFDDFAIYNEVYGNYFYDIVQKGPFYFSTVHWNTGGETSVANNVFIDCSPGPEMNTYDNAYDRMHTAPLCIIRLTTKDENDDRGVDITSDIWREKYPYLYDTYENNYIHGITNYNNFVCNGQYHNFVDENPSNLNFKFKKDSYMFCKYAKVYDRVRGINGEKVYFEDIDFDSIGLLKR